MGVGRTWINDGGADRIGTVSGVGETEGWGGDWWRLMDGGGVAIPGVRGDWDGRGRWIGMCREHHRWRCVWCVFNPPHLRAGIINHDW